MATRQRVRDLKIAAQFGAQVRRLRLERELTQEALAEAAGVHATYVSNVERGYRVPTLPTLMRLARGLGVKPGVLVDELDPPD